MQTQSQDRTVPDRTTKTSDAATANRDPITGAPGAHPIGTGVGAAAGGAAAGAAVGTVAGPAGTLVGAAVGAIIGGLAGKAVAERYDPTIEDAYWRNAYVKRPYVSPGSSYDDYGPAYRYGVDAAGRFQGRGFDELDDDLSRGWSKAKGSSRLTWDHAKLAVKDSWTRVSDGIERATPGDSDRDGK